MRLTHTVRLLTAAALLGGALTAGAAGAADDRPAYAPVDRPGPRLEPAAQALDQAISCTADVRTSRMQPVLFVPGTTVTPHDNFGWNWFRALDQQRRPYCAVTIPGNTTGDVQTSAQYVVHGIRTAHRLSGGKRVQVLGHSQGGMLPRVALRFWPDVRPMVDDLVSFAATHHGSPLITALCVPNCMPSLWQQLDTSALLEAVNSGQETFAGISYTALYTRLDQFVQPNLDDTGTSSLPPGPGRISNVGLQEVCPANTAEHLAIAVSDPTAYALAMDALTHDGPADPARIDPAVCTQTLMPGIDPLTYATDYAAAATVIARQLTVGPRVDSEPELRPWVFARR